MNQGYPPPPDSQREDMNAPQRVMVQIPRSKPFVTYALLGITIFVFVLQLASQTLLDGLDLPAALGMKINQEIISGQLWRLITPVLLHGSILHVGFNMYALNIFGPELERHFGRRRFLALYLISGFAGNVMSFLFSSAASLGSSTAIFGLLGAEGVFLYQNRELFGQTARRALVNIITVAGINLVIGLSPGIDNWGHIGGLIGGALFTWFGGPLLKVSGIYPQLILTDEREPGDIVRTAISVVVLFGLLASFNIYLAYSG